MNKKINITIPVGPGNPIHDSPKNDILEFTLLNIQEQTIRNDIELVCAIDSDLKEEKIKIIEKYADKIKVFGTYSYHRPGGIWLKIWECWKESECEYVSWQGYDDYSDKNRFKFQYETLLNSASTKHACFCSCYSNSFGNISKVHDGNIDFRSTVGNHPLFMGAYLINKNYILNSGLDEYKYKWSAYFEGLLNLYILKGGKPCVSSEAIFYYREHPSMLSFNVQEEQEWVQKARKETNYTCNEVLNDLHSIPYDNLISDLNKKEDLGKEKGKISWLFER